MAPDSPPSPPSPVLDRPSSPTLTAASSQQRMYPVRTVRYPSRAAPPSEAPSHPSTLAQSQRLTARALKNLPGSPPASPDDQVEDPLNQAHTRRPPDPPPLGRHRSSAILEGSGSSVHSGRATPEAPIFTDRVEHILADNGDTMWIRTGRDGELKKCEDEPIRIPGAVQGFGVLICFDDLGADDMDMRKLQVAQVSENSTSILSLSPAYLFSLTTLLHILSTYDVDALLEALDSLDARDGRDSNTDHSPLLFVLSGRGQEGNEWTAYAALHRPAPQAQPFRAVLELELVEDSLHPLQTTLPANNNCPRPTGAYPPFSEEDIRLSTEKVVKPLRALARFKARPVSRTSDGLDVLGLLRQVNEQLDAAMELEGFLRIVAGVFQELTEFSRVMVYQFDEAWNGRVVAEHVDLSKTSELFRGISFPAGDIPAQARELYRINKTRLLYDREQPTARMCCRSLAEVQAPLDMTHCHLRAMSPIHLKYLKNMGVQSSLSVSLSAFGDLWGLVACHGMGPARVSFPIRELCRVVGDGISRNIERLSYHKRLYSRKLIHTAPTDADPSGYIVADGEDLLTLFDASYGALSIGNEVKLLGEVENSQEVFAILNFIKANNFKAIKFTQQCTKDFPTLDFQPGFQAIAGFLTIPLADDGADFITFFRRGQRQDLQWAGNPHLAKQPGADPLEPRQSFARWSESVVGKSKAWTDEQLETAGVLLLIYGKFITVWRQKESALAASRLSSLLVANTSHELRTPLHQIIACMELALDQPVGPEVRKYLQQSHEASKSLILVINNLLDLTRAERGLDLFVNEPFSIPSAIEDVVAAHRAEALRRGLSLEVVESPSGTPPVVIGDRGKIRQLVGNLVGNAVKFTTIGSVSVQWGELVDTDVQEAADLRKDSIRIGITVIDTGCGMSADRLETLFREFEQVRSDAVQSSVIGLGLAVVARTVQKLGGQLLVDSAVGAGSSFRIFLPFRLPAADSAMSPPRYLQVSALSSEASIYDKLNAVPANMRAASIESANEGASAGSPHSYKISSFMSELGGSIRTSSRTENGRLQIERRGVLAESGESDNAGVPTRSRASATGQGKFDEGVEPTPKGGSVDIPTSSVPLRWIKLPAGEQKEGAIPHLSSFDHVQGSGSSTGAASSNRSATTAASSTITPGASRDGVVEFCESRSLRILVVEAEHASTALPESIHLAPTRQVCVLQGSVFKPDNNRQMKQTRRHPLFA